MLPRSRPAALVLAVLLLLLPVSTASAAPRTQLNVMSRNLYLGADLAPVLASESVPELVMNATTTWQAVQASNFGERARAIAKEIQSTRPGLIGLQEVALWRTDTPADGPATPAEDVALDFLDILMQEIAARGLDYRVASSVENFDGEVPTALGYDIRYTDHDVILARADVATANPQGANFSVGLPLPELVGGGIALRGWTSVDASYRGSTFRFVNTHPEAWGPDIIRMAQTGELIATALATNLPVVLVGDLNTEPSSGPYDLLLAAGFVDAWTTPKPGATCCQAPDLRNETSQLDSRIDYVMVRGLRTTAHRLVGATVGSKTPSGLWPSDHAGVVARVRL